MTTTYRTDRDGFPIETCGRCAGTGSYPSSAWNGVCLGCNGQRYTWPKGKIAELACQWLSERTAMATVTPAVRYLYEEDGTRTPGSAAAAVGDQIRLDDEDWRTIAAIRPTARVVGQTFIGLSPGWLRGVTLETVLTFADGTTVTTRGEQWRRRVDQDKAKARRAELVGQAVTLYERLLKSRATRAAKAEAQRAAADAERSTLVQALLEDHPELVTLTGEKYADARGFMADMRTAVLSGKPSDKQLTAAVEAVRRDEARERERADLVAAGVTCPTGRQTVEGTVVWVGAYDTDWGVSYRMRIRTDEGWNALGSVPRGLLQEVPFAESSNLLDPAPLSAPVDWLKGHRVRVTATFASSDRFDLSGKFSRPRVEVLDSPPEA